MVGYFRLQLATALRAPDVRKDDYYNRASQARLSRNAFRDGAAKDWWESSRRRLLSRRFSNASNLKFCSVVHTLRVGGAHARRFQNEPLSANALDPEAPEERAMQAELGCPKSSLRSGFCHF